MKKLIATLATLTVALGAAFAQDLAAVTELYNAGAEAISTDKAGALKSFEEALKLAEALGEEGQEVVTNCKNIIPNLKMSMAKDLVKESKFDEAVAALQDVEKVAQAYEALDVIDEAKELIPQIKMSKAGNLLNAKDYAGAAAAYQEILDADPENGTVALRLGVALNGAGKLDEAKAAFEKAAACWQYIKDNLIDWDGGEWFWSRHPDGTLNTVDDKAGFWKCPYHNSRMCLEVIERSIS
jgi:tetratricopeptide (TPR) repeat protein